MMDSYDLFSAMSGADAELIARSDFRVKRQKRQLFSVLTAAACVVIILISIFSLFLAPGPESLQKPPATVPFETESTEEPTLDPNRPLQLSGGDVGTLNIIQLSHTEETAEMPDFLMYINQEAYYIAEAAGTYYIYPKSSTENMPKCQMILTWQAGITPEAAAKQQAADLAAFMETVSTSEKNDLIEGILISGSNGTQWDSEMTDIYITDDLQGGVFIFTLKYYQQDTDGHAIWFRDMLQTFEVVTADRDAPAWMTDLQTSVDDFTAAFLKNSFSGMDDLIAEGAEIYTYGSDVYADTRILKTHYKVEQDDVPKTAYVSVRHKYKEDDAYDYITMELKYDGQKWQVAWAMIER